MKKLIAIIGLVLLSQVLPAFDMGGNIDNASSFFYSGDPSWVQGDTATLWLRFDSAAAGRFDIAGTLDLLYTRVWSSPNQVENLKVFPDFGITRWTNTFTLDKSALSFDIGRHRTRDLTGWIIDSLMDGLRVTWTSSAASVWFGLDYTGLVQKNNSGVKVSGTDVTNLKNDSVFLAPSRLVGSLGLLLPELFLRQDLAIEFSGQLDLASAPALAVHNGELAFKLTGPLAPGWKEQFFGVAQLIGDRTKLGFGFLVGGKIIYNLPIPGGSLALDGSYGSGQNGDLFDFQTIAGKSVMVSSVQSVTRLAQIGLDFSFDPAPKLTTGLKANAIFRTTTQVMGFAGFNQNSVGIFLGTEPNLYLNWDISSEFYLNFLVGCFIPNAGDGNIATFKAGTSPSLIAVLSFGLNI